MRWIPCCRTWGARPRVDQAMAAHVLAQAELMGTYQKRGAR